LHGYLELDELVRAFTEYKEKIKSGNKGSGLKKRSKA